MSNEDFNPARNLFLDEEGYALNKEGLRYQDTELYKELFSNLKFKDNLTLETTIGGSPVYLKPFAGGIVAGQVEKKTGEVWSLLLPGEQSLDFKIGDLKADPFDRFRGYTLEGIPFVFSRKAQFAFFDLVDEFGDDFFIVEGKKYVMKDYYQCSEDIASEDFWTKKYSEMNDTPPWELNVPHPAFVEILPRLKLQKSKVINLGCGSGNDLSLFAEAGHLCTGVDFSSRALENAKKKYSKFQNIEWIQTDIFNLPTELNNTYDLVLEHTCFAAILPENRPKLVQTWKKLLREKGFFLGIFFNMPKEAGPPFGVSEWELRHLFEKTGFNFLIWNHEIPSPSGRSGKELLVLCQK